MIDLAERPADAGTVAAEKWHAVRSPSSADRWWECPGSVAASEDVPRTSSGYADEGTAAHEVVEMTLLSEHKRADKFIGLEITVHRDNGPARVFTVDDEMAMHVQVFVDFVLDSVLPGGEYMAEQQVPLAHLTDEFVNGNPAKPATGTSDAIVFNPLPSGRYELRVDDFKYGRGVRVYAERSRQMLMYASGALELFGEVFDVEQVTVAIVQPRLDHIDEWSCSVEELREFEAECRTAVAASKAKDAPLVPGDKQCRFCPAKATCSALRREVSNTVFGAFEDLDTEIPEVDPVPLVAASPHDLSYLMRMTGLVETWVKAVRSEVETRLLQGKAVSGYKLVQGREGNRKWADEAAAAEAMKALDLDPYEPAPVISPAKLEKRVKKSGMAAFTDLITRSPGGLSVAPESDQRPAVSTDVREKFSNLSTEEDE